MKPDFERRRLTQREINEVKRLSARENGVKFPPIKVTFTRTKRDETDYAGFRATQQRPHTLKNPRVRIYEREPVGVQKGLLKHELDEIAGVLKGKSVSQAHKQAMKNESRFLKRLPFRTREGKPYQNLLVLAKRHDGERASSLWSRLRRMWP